MVIKILPSGPGKGISPSLFTQSDASLAGGYLLKIPFIDSAMTLINKLNSLLFIFDALITVPS